MAVEPALTPDPALVARFRADLEALTGDAPSRERRLGIAVSGGGDSLALLLLAAAAYPGAVAAATVDHGLRAGSAAEATAVAAVCERLGVGHRVLTVEFDPVHRNRQRWARGARYASLGRWAWSAGWLWGGELGFWRMGWLVTAHQQEDVAEGLLMRARRGAGVGGLAAMATRRSLLEGEYLPVRSRRREASGPRAVARTAGLAPSRETDERGSWPIPCRVALVRPLLGWSRAMLAGIVARAGVEPVADPSNADPRFDRARLRALIAASPDLPAAQLALAARNLRDAEEALAWAGDREWGARHTIAEDDAVLLDAVGLPHELKRRLARHAIDHVLPGSGTRPDAGLDRLVRLLDAGRTATLAGVLARPGPRWRFTPAPPRRTS